MTGAARSPSFDGRRGSWLRGCSSAGRALRSQCRGQGFDPPQLHVPLPLGVTGNTPDSGSGESWFDPRRGNSLETAPRDFGRWGAVFVCGRLADRWACAGRPDCPGWLGRPMTISGFVGAGCSNPARRARKKDSHVWRVEARGGMVSLRSVGLTRRLDVVGRVWVGSLPAMIARRGLRGERDGAMSHADSA